MNTLAERIERLYDFFPIAKENFSWSGYVPFLATVERLAKEFPRDLQGENLKRYEDPFYRNNSTSPLLELLSYLPPEIVGQEFGKEVLLWMGLWMYSFDWEKKKEGLFKVMEKKFEMESSLLKKAITFRRESKNKIPSLVEKTYELLEYLQQPLPQEKFASLLQQSGKEGLTLSSQRVKEYFFQGIQLENSLKGYHSQFGKRDERGVNYNIYLDEPLALCLFYKGEPQAVSGFYFNDLHTLMISQIQGVRKSIFNGSVLEKITGSRGLPPLAWESLLVRATGVIVRDFGFKNLGIQSAKNNIWARKEENASLSLRKARQRYDGTAKQLGFRREKFLLGNWKMEIKKLL